MRAASRQEPTVVREIVREPVVEVPAPVVNVPAPVVEVPAPVVEVVPQEPDSAARESLLRKIAGVLVLLGVIAYVYLITVIYDRFYSVLRVDPADVGLGYATTLSHSSGLIVIAAAIIGVLWFLLRLLPVLLIIGIGSAGDNPPSAVIGFLALVVGIATLGDSAYPNLSVLGANS
jgi:hypothetical protein